MEVALARRPDWVGVETHAAVIAASGFFFFLGEIYTDLPLPVDVPSRSLRRLLGLHSRLPDRRHRCALPRWTPVAASRI
jgi:hypothetical protein